MNQQEADALLLQNSKKIYGFALSRLDSIDRAEELASRIVLEVYASLLRAREVLFPQSYIYRIACNVYARFLQEETRHACVSLEQCAYPAAPEPAAPERDMLEQRESCALLRREIAFLSRQQREIVMLFYYDRVPQKEIARRLSITEGTVKWHLFEARKQLKEGVDMTRETGELGFRPIEFEHMGHSGSPGPKGDTADFLKSRLAQNIAYAAYWQPRTVAEIAQELGISPLFIEDIVKELEEYGFLDRLAGEKYRTHIYIINSTTEDAEKEHALYRQYATTLIQGYVPLVQKALSGFDKDLVYAPRGDENFLLWAAVCYAIGYCTFVCDVDYNEFQVKRKDGGCFAAFANLKTNAVLPYDEKKYATCGDMTRSEHSDGLHLESWQLNTCYDGRTGNWRENKMNDFIWLYQAYTGALPKDDAHIEQYRRLYEKGYLVQEEQGDRVNVVVVNGKQDFFEILPELPAELVSIGQELDKAIYAVRKPRFPEHMQAQCHQWSRNTFNSNTMRAYVLEQLLAEGILHVPQEQYRAGLNTILFADCLPK